VHISLINYGCGFLNFWQLTVQCKTNSKQLITNLTLQIFIKFLLYAYSVEEKLVCIYSPVRETVASIITCDIMLIDL